MTIKQVHKYSFTTVGMKAFLLCVDYIKCRPGRLFDTYLYIHADSHGLFNVNNFKETTRKRIITQV